LAASFERQKARIAIRPAKPSISMQLGNQEIVIALNKSPLAKAGNPFSSPAIHKFFHRCPVLTPFNSSLQKRRRGY
jgi:hypothetical protein